MVAPVVQLGKSIIYSFHFVVANRLFFYNHCVFWVSFSMLTISISYHDGKIFLVGIYSMQGSTVATRHKSYKKKKQKKVKAYMKAV